MTPSTLAVLLVALVIGVVLVALGWRGRRIDRSPICRGCGFDLTGMLPEGKTCPECGSGLARPKAVRIGRRRRLWPIAALGLIFAAAPLSLLAMTGYAALTGDSLTRYAPVGLLLAQVRHGNENAVAEAGAELVARLNAGSLDGPRRQGIIAAILDIQGDPDAPWDESLGDFIEVSQINADLSDAQYQRFLNQAMVFEFATRPIIAVEDPVPVGVSKVQDRVGSGSRVRTHIAIRDVRMGDTPLDWQSRTQRDGARSLSRVTREQGFTFSAWGSASGTGGGPTTQYFARVPEAPLEPGRGALHVEYAVEGQLAVVGRSAAFGAEPSRERLGSARLTCDVVPSGQRDLQLIPATDAMTRRLAQELGVEARIYSFGSTESESITILFDCGHLPVPLAHDAFVRIGGEELPIGAIQRPRADPANPDSSRYWGLETAFGIGVLPPDATSLTVILRPNIDRALERPDLLEMYDSEIGFQNVVIERQ